MNEERPVVINSLICFINNYRDEANLEQLLDYFPADSHRVAYQTLLELVQTRIKFEEKPSLIRLFDIVSSNPKAPIFATSDLTVLPVSLNHEKAPKLSKDLFTEIHQLRLMFQNAIDRNEEEAMFMSKQQQRQCPQSCSPKHEQFTEDEEMSSPSSDLPQSQTGSPASPSSSQFHVDALLQTQNSKKKTDGNRLDQAVRRITDRLGAKMFEEMDSRPTSTSSSNSAKREDDVSTETSQENSKNNLLNNNNTIPPNFMNLLSQPIFQNSTFMGHLQHLQLSTNPMALQLMQNLARNYQQQVQNTKLVEETDSENISVGTPDEVDQKPCLQLSPTSSEARTVDENQEKPFACTLPSCKKRFANKFLLKKHQFIHTGLRPHECPYCKKQFNRKDNLLRHKKTHINNSVSYAGRRRQNMLYGVSEDAAARLNNFPFLSELMTRNVDANDNIALN